jgi:MEDS: MEthanogen/methylotroph, DcmR Sensory domain
MNSSNHSSQNGKRRFGGEVVPHEHLVQIYTRPEDLHNSLEEYVAGGLRAGAGVIVVASRETLRELEARLSVLGLDPAALGRTDQLLTVDAEQALPQFMVGGWPDEARFRALVGEWLRRARRGGRDVRAFGEMVSILWAEGRNAATIRLEHLWHAVCEEEALCLFCAYPKAGFKSGSEISVHEICVSHTHVLAT